jgi:sterol desaturase/sphingolipid hydroxylase (fatty acid hydroxylase superfamily)
MADFLFVNETALRLIAFAGVLGLMMAAEALLPRRERAHARARRWPANLGIVVLNAGLLKLVFPVAAIGVATLAEARGWGLLNAVPVPFWLAVVVSVVVLDLVIYLQHVMFHAVPALWRLHRMHHADLDFDTTTGVRFHPIEILLSMVIKMAAVAALGAPALGVLLFEVLLNAAAMFNHANLRLPLALDRLLRLVIVTPDMHRVHHSAIPDETNSNYGFSLSWWDRLLGTYRAQPEAGHAGMTIGLETFRDPAELPLHRLLLQPFRGPVGRYPINRRGGGGNAARA